VRKIFDVAWNDVRVEFSSRWTLVFFLVLPIVFTAVIGAGLSAMYGEDGADADTRYPLLVVDEDGSDLSAELGAILAASDVIRPVFGGQEEAERSFAVLRDGRLLPRIVAAEREEAERSFAGGEAPALLTIPAGFGDALLAGEPVELTLREVMDDNRVFVVEQAVRAAASQVSNGVVAALVSLAERESLRPFASAADRQAHFEEGLALAQQVLQQQPVTVEIAYAPQVDVQIAGGFEQSSAGQLVTWVNITLIGAAEVFVTERLGGTLRRLLITPTRKATILSGKIVGRLGMGIVQMILLVGFGKFIFGVEWGRSPAALALVVLAFGLASVALGVLLGTFARTRGQASGLTILFSMLMAGLGGAWWPLEVTPRAYQAVVKVLPTTWAMIGFNDVIVRGRGVAGVLPEVGILLGFALLFFVVGIWRFRYE
jgi:ABC-2 type transport system permease protein